MTELATVAPITGAALAEAADVLAGLQALRQTLAPTLTDAELELFALIAKRKGLDPFSGQIVAVKRNTNRGPRVSYQTGIDGYRSIAERTGEYLGSDLPEFGPACDCGARPPGHPEWAVVTVHRLHPSGRVIDQPARAKWHEFVPSDAFMWGDKPEVMLGKCAEAQAFRRAFPWVLGDLYIPEEMGRADEVDATSAGPVVTARETVAARAAAIRGDAPATEATEPTEAGDGGGKLTPASATDQGFDVRADGTPPAEGAGELALAPELDAGPPPAGMSSTEFGARMAALGIPRKRVLERAVEVFPDRAASSLTPEEWGQLYGILVAEAPPGAP